MSPLVLSLRLGVLLFTSVPVVAQAGVEAIRYMPRASQLSSDFHGIAGGNLYGLGVPDVVFLAGTEPVLCLAPALHSTVRRLPGVGGLEVRDLALVPGGGRHGRDAVAMVTNAGLRLWLSDRVAPHHAVQSLGGAVWQNATIVRCGDVDGDEVPDLVGLMATGKRLRVFARGLGAPNYAIDFDDTILALALLQWDGTGAWEIAVLTQQQLVVRSGDGQTTLFQVNVPSAAGQLCRVPRSSGRDLLAWSTSALNGLPQLVVLGQVFGCAAIGLAAEATALTSGDVDHDGEGDVVVTLPDSPNPRFCIVQDGIVAELPQRTFDDVPVTGNRAAAFVADCDNDGDDDVVMPLPGSLRVAMLLGEATAAPSLPLQAFWLEDENTGMDRYRCVTQGVAPPDATHFEVRTWLLAEGPVGLGLGAFVATSFQELELGSGTFFAFVPNTNINAVEPIATAVRYVQLDGQGSLVRGHPFHCFVHLGFPMFGPPPPLLSTVILPVPAPPLVTIWEDFGDPIGGNPVGGSGGDGKLPPPPDEEDPPAPPGGG